MNILIIDTQSDRAQKIISVFEEAMQSISADASKINFYIWPPKLENQPGPEYFDIRLRHTNDGVENMPRSAVQLVYTGNGGAFNRENDETGFEYGFPFQMDCGEGFNFSSDHALQIITYYTENIFPQFLNSRFFEQTLENALLKFYPEVSKLKWPEINNNLSISIGERPRILLIWPDAMNAKIEIESFPPKSAVTRITNHQEWDRITDVECRYFDLVLLPAELRWTTNESYTKYSGLEVAKLLRRKRNGGIILLLSPAPIRIVYELRNKFNHEFDVIRAGFTYLIDISRNKDGGESLLSSTDQKSSGALWKQFQNEQQEELQGLGSNLKMTTKRQEDIRSFMLSQGALGEIIHEFKTNTNNGKRLENITESLQNTIQDLEGLVRPSRKLDLIEMQKKILDGPANHIYSAFLEARDKIEGWIDKNGLLDTINPHAIEKDWGALLLEDNEDVAKTVLEMLKTAGIPTWWAKTAQEAFKWLQDDIEGQIKYEGTGKVPGFIHVMIVDIRLETPLGRWQVMQGYDFIDKVTGMKNYLNVLILTQRERYMVETAGLINVAWLPKEVLKGESTKEILLSKVIEFGEEKSPKIPDIGLFKKGYSNHDHPFSFYYKRHRDNKDVHGKENEEINEIANSYFDLYRFIKEGSIKDIEDCKKRLLEKTGNIVDDLTVGIKDSMPESRQRQLFIKKMAARRAAIAIANKYYEKNNRWEKDVRQKFLATLLDILRYLSKKNNIIIDRDLLNKHLGLEDSVQDWPDLMLVEERTWLESIGTIKVSQK